LTTLTSYKLLEIERDELARRNPQEKAAVPEDDVDPLKRHQRRLAEPQEKHRGRTAKEQREALRNAFGLPHYNGDYADYFRHIRGGTGSV